MEDSGNRDRKDLAGEKKEMAADHIGKNRIIAFQW
jgi:hypothetical protein